MVESETETEWEKININFLHGKLTQLAVENVNAVVYILKLVLIILGIGKNIRLYAVRPFLILLFVVVNPIWRLSISLVHKAITYNSVFQTRQTGLRMYNSIQIWIKREIKSIYNRQQQLPKDADTNPMNRGNENKNAIQC